tara:strand:+ start:484 stop:780 length:297 start_codon:yes stop_codon:yes gene_type:complete
MDNSDKKLTPKQIDFANFLENVANQDSKVKKNSDNVSEEKFKEVIHPNSLITKNISLFTKNPNYKLLAWLLIQLLIFSIFIYSVSIFKNNLIPYLNSI